MKFSSFYRGVLTLSFLFSLNANAVLISPSGIDFDNLGRSTIDTSTGLEWLDVRETAGKSVSDVWHMLRDPNAEFNRADGWRYATRIDFSNLTKNWFGFADFDPQGLFLIHQAVFFDNESAKLELFVQTFGDMGPDVYSNNTYISMLSGFITGFLSESGTHEGQSTVSISDFDYLVTATGATVRQSDHIFLDGQPNQQYSADPTFGSFLVRCTLADSSACITGVMDRDVWFVSEPMSPALLLFGLAMLGLRNRRTT